MSTLYVVATPIGNLEDITLRALRVLKEVAVIFCEDTRMTKRLLTRYDIKTPVRSYHAHSTPREVARLLDVLTSGADAALVCDAGTPTISDPGARLIEAAMALSQVEVVAVPGPSALTAALSISGIPASEFHFVGFLPHKKGRQSALTAALSFAVPVVLYESPHRIARLLTALSEKAPERKLVIARELTKVHEEVVHGTALEHIARHVVYPEKVRGEFVVIVLPA